MGATGLIQNPDDFGQENCATYLQRINLTSLSAVNFCFKKNSY